MAAIAELKEKVSLFSYLEEQGHHLKHIGKDSYWINPCPKCGSKDHFTVYKNTDSYSSFSDCCKGGSIYDYLIHVEDLPEEVAREKLHKLAGLSLTDWREETSTNEPTSFFKLESETTKNASDQRQSKAQAQPNSELDFTDYITDLYNNSFAKYPNEMKTAFLDRGITVNEIMKYKLSIYKDTDGLRAMFPVWQNGKVVYYIGRALEGQKGKYKNAKGVANHFFNVDYLDKPQETPIIITEGIVDAISLERLGFKAIALNSVQNASKLIELIRTKPKAQNTIFLTAFDNDDAGREAAKTMPYKSINIPKEYKDINEWLIDSSVRSQEAPSDVLDIEVDLTKQMTTATQPDAIMDYLEHGFFSDIETLKPFRNKKTGFDNLDNEMKGLYAGLYVVGGISSVGKTTFVHQLGDQLAEQGDHVLYFSLEQSKLEMVSKSLARTTHALNSNAGVQSIKIRNGFKSQEVTDAINEYKKIAGRVSIIEGNFNTNAETIRKYVEMYIQQNNVSPVVIVDYLQIMPAVDERLNDKARTDMNVTALKRMSRDFSIPVFVISSLNRGNYLAPIDFESFKESGGIEYTADVVWGLQLAAIHDPVFNKDKSVKEKREVIAKAKAANPREIELVCLKNRNGNPSFSCGFTYWSNYDRYVSNLHTVEEGIELRQMEADKEKPKRRI